MCITSRVQGSGFGVRGYYIIRNDVYYKSHRRGGRYRSNFIQLQYAPTQNKIQIPFGMTNNKFILSDIDSKSNCRGGGHIDPTRTKKLTTLD
jgi:hypothetical protein